MKNLTIPLQLIEILSDGEFHSGEKLGEQLGMTRAAVNKYIKIIKSWGLGIHRVPGKGYSLHDAIQLLNEKIILSYFPQGKITVLPVVDSTNQYLLDRINQLCSGDTCIAEYQWKGRGRRGRTWYTPFGSTICFSMFWCLEQGPETAPGLSLVVGIVIAEILQDMGAKGVRVKWPNDLYLHDKKLAGILVELIGKMGDAAQIVIGVGINLFISELQGTAINQAWINLQEAGVIIDRNKLVAKLLSELQRAIIHFENQGLTAFISRWKALDNYLDRPVKLILGDKVLSGIARGIDQQGALLFEQNGKIASFMAGEISLRSV